jgi:trimethylamine--corrinoid protein Co-methyltransferase
MVQLTVLTDKDIESIHHATLQVLNESGIVLIYSQGRQLLLDAGATSQDDLVFLPPELVESAIAKCPGQVAIKGRGGEIINLGDGSLHWHNLGGARDIYDPRTEKCKPATIQEVRESTRLLDALDAVTTITPFFTPQDAPGPLMSLAMYRYALPNTTKPLHSPGVQTDQEVSYIFRMAEVIGPPTEFLTLSLSPVSPLTFPNSIVAAIMEIARFGFPFGPLPCPIAGATSPLSLAGALVQQNAEILASIVLAQLVHPGLPIIYCGRLAMMEPRTGLSVWGGVELGLASAATVQIGHHYGLPVNVYGLSTNAHILDLQNGYERALNAAIPALAGADELSGIGEMAAGVSGSYAQIVCDNEIAASVRRLRRGFSADVDALAVDVITSVMQGDRNFLGQKHTLQYLRAGELLVTQLAERHTWETWDHEGRQGMIDRAQAEAERLLSEHQVTPLSEAQEFELNTIMSSARRDLVHG